MSPLLILVHRHIHVSHHHDELKTLTAKVEERKEALAQRGLTLYETLLAYQAGNKQVSKISLELYKDLSAASKRGDNQSQLTQTLFNVLKPNRPEIDRALMEGRKELDNWKAIGNYLNDLSEKTIKARELDEHVSAGRKV